jgi:hypothetical protein
MQCTRSDTNGTLFIGECDLQSIFFFFCMWIARRIPFVKPLQGGFSQAEECKGSSCAEISTSPCAHDALGVVYLNVTGVMPLMHLKSG